MIDIVGKLKCRFGFHDYEWYYHSKTNSAIYICNRCCYEKMPESFGDKKV